MTKKMIDLSKTSAEKVKEKVVKKSTATTKKPSTSEISTSRQALLDKINMSFAGATRMSSSMGGRFNFVRLSDKDRHVMRLVLPPEGPFVIAFKHQKGTKGGNFGSAIDLDWLIDPHTQKNYPDLITELQKTFTITTEDLSLINKYGEPYNRLFKALQALDLRDKFIDSRIGAKRAIFVVYYENEFSILEHNVTAAKIIHSLVEELGHDFILDWPNSKDIIIRGEGKGVGGKNPRRYDPPILSPTKGKVIKYDPDEQSIPNLYDVLAARVLGYKDKVKFMFNSHRGLIDEAQLTLKDFGLEDNGDE